MEEDRRYTTKWVDFAIYPLNDNIIRSMNERIDTSRAFYPNDDGSYPKEYSPSGPEGAVIVKDKVERFGEQFKAMFFDHFGNVTVWTTGGIWHTRNLGTIEKFMFTPYDHRELAR